MLFQTTSFTSTRRSPTFAQSNATASALALSDAKLYEAIVEKKAWALSALYDRYATVLYSLAFNILQRENTAQEIVEKTFVMLWRKSAAVQQSVRDHVGGWLIMFCRGLAITSYRVQNHLADTPNNSEQLEEWATAFVGSIADSFPRTESASKLREALERLPGQQRNIVEMIFLKGMTANEIARTTRLAESEVRAQVHGALMKMKEQL